MPNSITLSALIAYAHWADSVREYDDMFRDDTVLPDLRSTAQLRRNALRNQSRTMTPMFVDVVTELVGEVGLSVTAVRDAGSGYNPDTGLAELRAVALVSGYPYSIHIDHEGHVSLVEQ